jgi:hypothetical protein
MPIGSCRVRGILERAREERGLEVELRLQYGLIYNTPEILQQLAHMAGELAIPVAARQFLEFTRVKWLERGPGLAADLFLIEISNPRCLIWNGFSLQHSSVHQVLITEGAPAIWDLLWHGDRRDESGWRARIAADRDFDDLSSDVQDFLMSVVVREQTPEELQADMAAITQRLGRERVCFMAKATVADSSGRPPPERQRFVRDIAAAASALGVRFYDPTPLMRELGEARGVRRDSGAVHYTTEFESRALVELSAEGVL